MIGLGGWGSFVDLAHGGAPQTRPELTRRSIVTHFCPVDNEPTTTGEAGNRRAEIFLEN